MKAFISLSIVSFTVILCCGLFGCANQYSNATTVSNTSGYPKTIEKAMKAKRYFVMQSGINLYTVTSVDIDKPKQQMTVTLDKLDSLHLANFKNPVSKSSMSNGQKANSSIYIYMKDSTNYTLDEPHTIPVKNIDRIQLVD